LNRWHIAVFIRIQKRVRVNTIFGASALEHLGVRYRGNLNLIFARTFSKQVGNASCFGLLDFVEFDLCVVFHVRCLVVVRIPRTRKIYDITTIFAKQNYSQSKVFFVNNLVRVRTTFRRPARQNLVRIRMICFS